MLGCFNFFRHGFLGGGMMMFLGLVVIIAFAYLVLKKNETSSFVKPADLLKTKYINGDITRDEYEEKLEVLSKHK